MTDAEFRALVLEAFKVLPTGDYHYPLAPNQLRHLVARAVEAEREAICPIVYGLCVSDNNAQEIVNAIRARRSGAV